MNNFKRRRTLPLIGAITLVATLLFLLHVSLAYATSGVTLPVTLSRQAQTASVASSNLLNPVLQTSATISATKRDELVIDADGSGAAGPGDTLKYTIIVTNNGAIDAHDVLITDTLDASTSLTATVTVSPIAGDDQYDVLGNTYISITAASGVLANDIDPDGGGITLQGVGEATTEEGGDITLNADGSFMYDPPAGFSGDDFFRYTIEDDDGLQAMGVIHFSVSDVIWYVDAYGASGGDGRLSAPFDQLAAAQSAAGSGHIIFLFEGNHNGSLNLGADQQLIGQGVDLAGGAGLIAPAGTVLPGKTVSPTLSGHVVLGQDNTIRGLSLAQNGTTALSGSNFGSVTVSNVSVTGTGRGLNLEGGAVTATFEAISSTDSSNEGIRLVNISGNLTIDGGAITGADNAGFYVSGSTANIAYGGSISAEDSGAYAVRIADNSGGVVSLDGSISSTSGFGRGISLTNNGGTAVAFSGSITLNTGANTAFIASGGGAVTATGSGSTLQTSGAPAVTIENTAIGGASITFERISVENSAKGIVLNNAGSGGFTVTGTGSDSGSGGVMANISARAIEVINTDNVTFANIALSDANTQDGAGACDATNTAGCNAAIYLNDVTAAIFDNVQIGGTIAQQGINGIDVNGFSLLNSTINGCGGEVEEGCAKMRNLTGSVQIAGSDMAFAAERIFEIRNDSGTLDLTITGSTFRDTQTSTIGLDGLEIVINGTAQASVSIADSEFLRLRTNGLQMIAEDQSVLDLDVTGSTFDVESGIGKGIELAAANDATLTFDVIGNPLIHSRGGNAITVAAFDQSSIQGRINNNNDIRLGGTGTYGNGIMLQVNENAGGRVEIKNNTIGAVGWEDGIYVLARREETSGTVDRLDVIIEQNSVASSDSNSLYGIELFAQKGKTLCADVRSNTVNGPFAAAFSVEELELESINGVVLLEGFTSNAQNTWSANGNAGSPVNEYPLGAASSGTCQAPTHAYSPMAERMTDVATETQAPVSQVTAYEGTQLSRTVINEPQLRISSASKLTNAPVLQTAADVVVGPFTLPAGKVVTITFQVEIASPLAAGVPAQVGNQAWISGSNFATTLSDDPDTVQPGDATVTTLDAAPDLTLGKDDGGVAVTPGDTISYELTYANDGNQHAAGVVITETIPDNTTFNAVASSPGWFCPGGSGAGATCTIGVGQLTAGAAADKVIFAVTVLDVVAAGAEQISNVAVIADDGSGGAETELANNEATATSLLVAQPDFRLSKTSGDATVSPGDNIEYTLTYTNAGNQGATGVVISEVVPAHTTFDAAASSAGWSCADGSVVGTPCTFTVGSLNGGVSGAVDFVVTVDVPVAAGVEQVSNSATIADDGTNGEDGDDSDNSATVLTAVDAAASLELEKDDGSVVPGSGDTLTYSLVLRNSGNQAATGVVFTDTVPANTSFDAANSDARWSCAPDGSAGSVCTLTLSGELVGGAQETVQYAVVVDSALPAGVSQVENQAQADAEATFAVSSDDPVTPVAGDATITNLDIRADLAVSKDDETTVAIPGEPLTYTIVVHNHGPDMVIGATVSDILPVELRDATWTCTAGVGASCAAAAGSGDLNESVDLGVGAMVTYTLRATVDAAASGTLINRASVSPPAGVSDPVAANDSDVDDDTSLTPQVDLALAISDWTDPVIAGSGPGNHTYVVTVTNRGPSVASNVTVVEAHSLPAGVTLDGVVVDLANASFAGDTWTINELGVGHSEMLTATLTVDATAAAGANVVSMTATASGADQVIVSAGDDT